MSITIDSWVKSMGGAGPWGPVTEATKSTFADTGAQSELWSLD